MNLSLFTEQIQQIISNSLKANKYLSKENLQGVFLFLVLPLMMIIGLVLSFNIGKFHSNKNFQLSKMILEKNKSLNQTKLKKDFYDRLLATSL